MSIDSKEHRGIDSTEEELGGLFTYEGTREIADGVQFLKECICGPPAYEADVDSLDWYEEGRAIHVSQNAYFIDDEETLLFDTLTPVGDRVVVERLEELLDGRDLDYLVISHPEANHAGNTWEILEAYPEATLVAPKRGSHHDLFEIDKDEDMLVEEGDTIDLGEHEVEFLEPVFYDHAMTVWMRETTSDTLFTVDFMGFEHMDGECMDFADELESPLTSGRLERFNSYAFVWLRYADEDAIDDAIDRVKDDIDPSIIAPAHGQVIREDADEYLEVMRDAVHNFCDIDPETYHVHTHTMRAGRQVDVV